jgi:acyl-CoA synthetase (AMP-forming)/AMP-acid ligase II
MIRYFKQEELTKETITEDGWYKTGDIGQWESDGTLSIIDRIKNLVRLSVASVMYQADSRSNCRMENTSPLTSWNRYTKPAVRPHS